MSSEELVGEVFHYYNDKGMAYLKLSGRLVGGQTLHFKDPDGDFFQTIDEMQVANQTMHVAYPGDYVGIHVGQTLHEHDPVFVQA
jgi:hypothetical protein